MQHLSQPQQSPRRYRWALWLLSCLLTLLFYWLLNFVVGDIGNLPGPRYDQIERQLVSEELLNQIRSLGKQREDLQDQIRGQRQIQEVLRQSMEESRTTMDQLIELHRLSLEKGDVPSEAQKRALAESQQLFLAKQEQFQASNETLAQLNEQIRALDRQLKSLNEQRAEASKRVRQVFNRRMRSHRLKVASLKLAFLLPVLLVATGLVMKRRGSRYAPIFYALLIAAFARVMVLMHQYFPRQWFKYLAVLTGIGVVLLFLVQLIRLMTSSRTDWLLKRYREAYQQHLCPACGYPFPAGESGVPSTTYTCPSCGTSLFEPCSQCEAIRHTLLPFCESCGAERTSSEEEAEKTS